jgi:sulfotransferase family protein
LDFEEVPVCGSPIFVLGSPRSGTTMLGWSLAQHSRLWTSGEASVIQGIFQEKAIDSVLENARVLGDGAFLTQETVDRAELLRHLGVGVNALYTSRSGERRWIDHTPSNTLLVELLGDLFPSALFLHLLRDGRQVVDSMINFLTAMPEERRASFEQAGWTISWLDFTVACETWRDHVQAASAFAGRQPDRCLTVVHGQLVADPQQTYAEIFEFLGISFEEPPVRYAESLRVNTSFPTRGGGQAKVGYFSTPWQEWPREERETFAEIAGPTMVQHGLATAEELELKGVPENGARANSS